MTEVNKIRIHKISDDESSHETLNINSSSNGNVGQARQRRDPPSSGSCISNDYSDENSYDDHYDDDDRSMSSNSTFSFIRSIIDNRFGLSPDNQETLYDNQSSRSKRLRDDASSFSSGSSGYKSTRRTAKSNNDGSTLNSSSNSHSKDSSYSSHIGRRRNSSAISLFSLATVSEYDEESMTNSNCSQRATLTRDRRKDPPSIEDQKNKRRRKKSLFSILFQQATKTFLLLLFMGLTSNFISNQLLQLSRAPGSASANGGYMEFLSRESSTSIVGAGREPVVVEDEKGVMDKENLNDDVNAMGGGGYSDESYVGSREDERIEGGSFGDGPDASNHFRNGNAGNVISNGYNGVNNGMRELVNQQDSSNLSLNSHEHNLNPGSVGSISNHVYQYSNYHHGQHSDSSFNLQNSQHHFYTNSGAPNQSLNAMNHWSDSGNSGINNNFHHFNNHRGYEQNRHQQQQQTQYQYGQNSQQYLQQYPHQYQQSQHYPPPGLSSWYDANREAISSAYGTKSVSNGQVIRGELASNSNHDPIQSYTERLYFDPETIRERIPNVAKYDLEQYELGQRGFSNKDISGAPTALEDDKNNGDNSAIFSLNVDSHGNDDGAGTQLQAQNLEQSNQPNDRHINTSKRNRPREVEQAAPLSPRFLLLRNRLLSLYSEPIPDPRGILPQTPTQSGEKVIPHPLYQNDSPQYKALHWLADMDQFEVSEADPGVIQRFTLAVLYYSTGGPTTEFDDFSEFGGKGNSNGRKNERDQNRNQSSEQKTRNANAGPWRNPTNFLSPQHECNWKSQNTGRGGGVRRCDKNQNVLEISLYNDLTGNIPSEIGRLSFLQVLYLGRNHLSGTLPTQLGMLTKLTHMILSNNELTGEIPEESWTGLRRLRALHLEGNVEMSGAIERHGPLCQMRDNYVSPGKDIGKNIPTQIDENGANENRQRRQGNGKLRRLSATCSPSVGNRFIGTSHGLVCECCSECVGK